jgi:hypothetical protein
MDPSSSFTLFISSDNIDDTTEYQTFTQGSAD